ncbi:hypothetical protein PMAYCL1PPCAC_15090, partial [Pristionchus mayeri]
MALQTRELYKLVPDFPLVIYGSSTKHVSENDERSLVTILIGIVVIPYSASYGIFVMLAVLIRLRIRQIGVASSARTIKMQRALYIMQILQ